MGLYFTKMHGLGNDFMVIDGIRQKFKLTTADIRALSQRHTGIGFDQCLVVEPPKSNDSDFFYRIFNANGQEVGQCGNGARCIARFLHYYQLTDKKTIKVATKTTLLQLTINSDDTVTVNFGRPQTHPQHIPLAVNTPPATSYPIKFPDDTGMDVHVINVGNPHAVLMITDILNINIQDVGKYISEYKLFPQQANVGFMEILTPQHLKLRVYERGCGETQACGSGAVAAAAICRLHYHGSKCIEVSLSGGSLWVEWPNIDNDIFLTGTASFVYEGKLINL